MLKPGSVVKTQSGKKLKILETIGSGGQGEVFKVTDSIKYYALKVYHSNVSFEQFENLKFLISKTPPSKSFVWPLDLYHENNRFGYLMEFIQKRYKKISDIFVRKSEPTFKILFRFGYNLANAFFQLHSKGLCYKDISHSNILFAEDNGDILIIDNDNITVNNNPKSTILGTPRFMAPEIVRKENYPDNLTDLYSLSVLLFYILFLHHPLEGEKEYKIKCFDDKAMELLYGKEPIFIFDPNDTSNRPVHGYHNNAIIFWNIYPDILKNIFLKAFTEGLKDRNKRVRESEWKQIFLKIHDMIVYCEHCGVENFYKENQNIICWNCQKILTKRLILKINSNIIVLNYDAKIYRHNINPSKVDFEKPIGIIKNKPDNPKIWGLQNLSDKPWTATISPNNVLKEIKPGQTITIKKGIKLNLDGIDAYIIQ